jgi:hypothetical protein
LEIIETIDAASIGLVVHSNNDSSDQPEEARTTTTKRHHPPAAWIGWRPIGTGSLLSYTVTLSPPPDFTGGGTFFDALRRGCSCAQPDAAVEEEGVVRLAGARISRVSRW